MHAKNIQSPMFNAGQIHIAKWVRNALDLNDGDELLFEVVDNKIMLAPGAHSQFGSGKNTQFEPEQRANPFENVFSKTAVFPPPAIAETDL